MSRAEAEVRGRLATTWALTVATYKRHQVLVECVRRALGQTVRPAEVVVVDASPNWQEGKLAIEALCREAGVPCQYVEANVPSLAVQRNQAIDLARADVLFMIDDDAMLFPDAAEHVLAIYDADRDAGVAGVQISPVDESPPSLETGPDVLDTIDLKPTGPRDWLKGSALGRFVYREILLMSRERTFVPYLGRYPDPEVAPEVTALGARPVRLFTGCAMTYRRSVIEAVRFNSLLRSYCPAEDLDASYRASLRGCLVVAPRARLRHIEVASGRIKRRVATCLWASNQALFLRQNTNGGAAARQRDFAVMVARRLFAELLKDAGSKRLDFPQFRGVLQAVPICRKLFTLPDDELEPYYTRKQTELLATKA